MLKLPMSILLGLFVLSCTQTTTDLVMPEHRGAEQGQRDDYRRHNQQESPQNRSTGTVPIQINQEQFVTAFAVSANGLTYRFQYLDIVRDGTIEFVNGTASIRIEGLPVGRTGVLRLDIFENGQPSIFGVNENVQLVAGNNSQRLTLRKVNDQDRGSLNVDIFLEDLNNNSTPQPGPAPSPLSGADQEAFAIIVKHCSECHHQGRPNNTFASWPMQMAGATSQKVILQRILTAVQAPRNAPLAMPPAPRDALTGEEIAKLNAWMNRLP